MEKSLRKNVIDNPHIVIIGAGASKAALPEGDKNGRFIPVMDDLFQLSKVKKLLEEHKIESKDLRFEEFYSSLHKNDEIKIINELEKILYDYFSRLKLPDVPTIYDYLILSLRETDVIASFNWDPFLVQAYQRVKSITNFLPQVFFLHGTVALSRCSEHFIVDIPGNRCPTCGKVLDPIKLLYPVKKKNYTSNFYIKEQWEALQHFLENANGMTIFGYSVPETDVEAARLMKQGWGNSEKRMLDEIEIIDLKDQHVLKKTWDNFIYDTNYTTFDDYFDCSIANFPRRVNEYQFQRYNLNMWLENHFIESGLSFDEIEEEFRQIIDHEEH